MLQKYKQTYLFSWQIQTALKNKNPPQKENHNPNPTLSRHFHVEIICQIFDRL